MYPYCDHHSVIIHTDITIFCVCVELCGVGCVRSTNVHPDWDCRN